MITKNINGVKCQLRDAVFSDFGAVTITEKTLKNVLSSEKFKDDQERRKFLENRTYSWSNKTYGDINILGEDRNFSSGLEYNLDNAVLEDRTYSSILLSSRLIYLRRPLYLQLKELYRAHKMFYKQKKNSLKEKDLDLLIDDFRYELHKIIAKSKEEVIKNKKTLDTILRMNSLLVGESNKSVQTTLRKLTMTFKRSQKYFDTYNFIPKTQQIRLNEALNILVSHFILDVYGEALNKKKMGTNLPDDKVNKDKGVSKSINITPSAGVIK